MRRVARWIGELVAGRPHTVPQVLIRAALMIALAIGCFAIAAVLVREDTSDLPGARAWMGVVVVAVALIFRAGFELYELDGWLCAATIVGLALAGMGAGAWTSLEGPGDPLVTRMLAFFAAALAALAVAAWRARTVWRAER